jgi:regulator of sirC expression with transglutaminase-like and TPR domain
LARIDDPAKEYRQAERRLREMLLGDGTFTAGLVKGEERRIETTRVLRRMRDAFDAALAETEEGGAKKAEARIADLEEQLRKRASARSRGQAEVDT